MKIQIASDLHLEFREHHMPFADEFVPVADRDVLVLAGDIGVNMMAEGFVERELEVSPVIYAPGNHEYYIPGPREEVDRGWRGFAQRRAGFHYLVRERVEIAGVRFYGTPWYSDLWGSSDPWELAGVQSGIYDFSEELNFGDHWTISAHMGAHALETEMLRDMRGRVDVVVTHWPPSRGAIHPRYKGNALNPYFVNDKPELVFEVGARLWISGHTHEPYAYWLGGTRCLGNPCGYPGEWRESKLFKPDLVVEI